MKLADVRAKAFAMPFHAPSFPPGPYRYYRREHFCIDYRTDRERLQAIVPEPLEPEGDHVEIDFVHSPDSTGFGPYTRCGQRIPVLYRGERGFFVHAMYLDNAAPIAGGREIWGFPQMLAKPALYTESEVLVATLHVGSGLCAVGTMGYKHVSLAPEPILEALTRPNYLVKVIPHVDGSARVCELVRYRHGDIALAGAWSGPAALQLFEHVVANVARLPVRELVGATHFVTDLTLGLGEVVVDYLALDRKARVSEAPATMGVSA
jgi:acetoacetate decarboxylase